MIRLGDFTFYIKYDKIEIFRAINAVRDYRLRSDRISKKKTTTQPQITKHSSLRFDSGKMNAIFSNLQTEQTTERK